MDLEEWEILPKNNYKGLDLELDLDLGLDEDNEEKKMMKNTGKSFDMDYFICPIYDSVGKTEFLHHRSSMVPTQLLQIPITWEPVSTIDDTEDHKKYPGPDFSETDPELLTDPFPSPRITFKKTKETKFADMKIDSLASPLAQNDDKHSDSEGGLGGEYYDEVMGSEGEESCDLRSKKEVDWDGDESIGGERMNLWKKGLNGIGAICSFGVAAAAATICVFFLGHNNSIKGCRNKNQILRFQIYSDDNKRMNEVVKHATKLNEVISVMKGLPVARAQISFGGYYDGL